MKSVHPALLLVCFLLGACATTPRESRPPPTPLILISIDGFRVDYLDRGLTPRLQALADSGVRAEYLRPSFPSLTFPNHYALITGLRPDRNGIVANTMEDERIPGQQFTASNRDAITNPAWWNEATPLWRTAQRNGLRSATMFWPGSEAPTQGAHPDYWSNFDKTIPSKARVDSVLGWLDLPADQRPVLITLYLDTIDIVGHHDGPDSAELDTELQAIDAAIGRLIDGLDRRGLGRAVNLVIVSDHGMIATAPERVIFLDSLLAENSAHVVGFGVLTGIVPNEGQTQAVEALLLTQHAHMNCWRKSELPERFHYGNNKRVPPLLCLAKHGWIIFDHATLAKKKRFSLGEHGYDNEDADMRAIFIAQGPGLRKGLVVPPFDNVDVYALLAHLLGIRPEANDGDLDILRPALIDSNP